MLSKVAVAARNHTSGLSSFSCFQNLRHYNSRALIEQMEGIVLSITKASKLAVYAH